MNDMRAVFESVARYFSVLGEPARLHILHSLCSEEKPVNEIIKVTGLAQANVSRHLGLMYQAGVVSRRREGTQVFYRVADPVYAELCRTVSAQVSARAEQPDATSAAVGQPAQDPLSRPADRSRAKRNPPANHKEEASV